MNEKITINRRDFLLFTGGALFTAMLPCNTVVASDSRPTEIEFVESTCRKNENIPKRLLITYASRCGSTGEVAEAISQTLCGTKISTDVLLVENVNDLSPYQAVIIGSAIRAGKWLPEAVAFVKKHQETLSRMPLAYFVVCMAMKDDTEENRRTALAFLDPLHKAVPQVRPVDTGLFAGATDFDKLSIFQSSILKVKGVPEGDFRNWDAIRAWAVTLQPALFGST